LEHEVARNDVTPMRTARDGRTSFFASFIIECS
jgi:hypothetical protein